jgi:ACS family hexuronate transporter-like MFS transporter
MECKAASRQIGAQSWICSLDWIMVDFGIAVCLFARCNQSRRISVYTGAGEAGNYPAGVKLIREWFPAHERSVASGIFNSGGSVGAIVAQLLLAWTALKLGWRSACGLVSVFGFIWVVVWLLLYRGTPARGDAVRTSPPSVRALTRSRFVAQFTLS